MKEFDEDELCQLAWGDYEGVELVEVVEGEDDRWTRFMTTIFRFEGKLYALEWQKGLTEYQPNEFFEQPYEVEAVERVITVTDYIRKGE